MLLRKLPHKGPRYRFFLQEPTMGQDHHALLTPRKHHVRSPFVLHEPGRRRSDYRDYDVVFLVSLERVDIEHCIFPGESCHLECILDRVSLSVVRGDDLEIFALLDVLFGYANCGFDFTLVLRRCAFSASATGWCLGRVARTIQLSPFLISSPLLTSTKRQQV